MEDPRILKVTREGATFGWLELQTALERAEFVAVDTEFTGFSADDERVHAQDLEERYKGLCNSVKSRAIVQLGISVFMNIENGRGDEIGLTDVENSTDGAEMLVRTFEFLMCCQGDFVVSSSSGEFLSKHGFDFSHMFREGIPYTPASRLNDAKSRGHRKQLNSVKVAQDHSEVKESTNCDPELVKADNPKSSRGMKGRDERGSKNNSKLRTGSKDSTGKCRNDWRALPSGLLWRIGMSKKPLVVHNGLYDLLFLYSAFEAPLPNTLQQFIGEISYLLPIIYDTRLLASDTLKQKFTNLAYLYAKCRRRHIQLCKCDSVAVFEHDRRASLICVDGLASFNQPDFAPYSTEQNHSEHEGELCDKLRTRGFCPRSECTFDHSFERLIDLELGVGPSLPIINSAERSSPTRKKPNDAENNMASRLRRKKRRKLEKKRKSKASNALACEQRELTGQDSIVVPPNKISQAGHSAGYDAFCTGFVFGTIRQAVDEKKILAYKNSVWVSAKHQPLLVERSRFIDPCKHL